MLELKSTTLSSLGTAVIAMVSRQLVDARKRPRYFQIIICIFFIADRVIVYFVTFILVSMDIGVAGYLSLWGADLDPTTVVNILVRLKTAIVGTAAV